MNRWSIFFDQLRALGKHLVRDDIHDLGYFKYFGREGHKDHPGNLHHWQYGVLLWALSEYLTLLNVLFPFDREIQKRKIRDQIHRVRIAHEKRDRGLTENEARMDLETRRARMEHRAESLKESMKHSFQIFSRR